MQIVNTQYITLLTIIIIKVNLDSSCCFPTFLQRIFKVWQIIKKVFSVVFFFATVFPIQFANTKI